MPALSYDSYLQSVCANRNSIGEEGIEALLEFTKEEPRILQLDLRENEGYSESVH